MVHFNYVYKWNAEQMLKAPFQVFLPHPRGRVSVLILHLSLKNAWFEKLLKLKYLVGLEAILAPFTSKCEFFSCIWVFKYVPKLPFLTFYFFFKFKKYIKKTRIMQNKIDISCSLTCLKTNSLSFTCICAHIHTHTYIYIHTCCIIF